MESVKTKSCFCPFFKFYVLLFNIILIRHLLHFSKYVKLSGCLRCYSNYVLLPDRMWWRGWPAFLWWAPPTAWCPACTPTPRTATLTSGPCARWRSKASGPSPTWPSPVRRPSSTSWSLRVRTLLCGFENLLESQHSFRCQENQVKLGG